MMATAAILVVCLLSVSTAAHLVEDLVQHVWMRTPYGGLRFWLWWSAWVATAVVALPVRIVWVLTLRETLGGPEDPS